MILSHKSRRLALIFLIIIGISVISSLSLLSAREVIVLPLPQISGARSLEECLALLTKVTAFKETSLSLQELSQLLWAAQGITDPVLKFRTVPSAGALYPLEIYVVVGPQSVNTLDEGVYLYASENHQLSQTQVSPNIKAQMSDVVTFDQDRNHIHNAPVSLVITAVYERTMQKYFDRGIQYVHLEVGCVAQHVYLQAAAIGLGASAITQFDEVQLRALLDSPMPLLIMPIGEPRSTIPLETESSLDPLSSDLLQLPLQAEASNQSLEEAILNRRSIREYDVAPLSVQQIRQILWMARRTIPMSNESLVNILICVGEVENLSQGIYSFIPDRYLHQISSEDVRERLGAGAGESGPWVQTGKVCLILYTTPPPDGEAEASREKTTQFEIGMVAQNIHLQVAALNLGTVTVGAFNDTQILSTVNLTTSATPWFLMPIGHRVS